MGIQETLLKKINELKERLKEPSVGRKEIKRIMDGQAELEKREELKELLVKLRELGIDIQESEGERLRIIVKPGQFKIETFVNLLSALEQQGVDLENVDVIADKNFLSSITSPVPISAVSHEGQKPVYHAAVIRDLVEFEKVAIDKNIGRIKELLEGTKDPKLQRYFAAYAFLVAAKINELGFAKEILSIVPEVDLSFGVLNFAALDHAIENNSKEFVELILDSASDNSYSLDVDKRDIFGDSPLSKAEGFARANPEVTDVDKDPIVQLLKGYEKQHKQVLDGRASTASTISH